MKFLVDKLRQIFKETQNNNQKKEVITVSDWFKDNISKDEIKQEIEEIKPLEIKKEDSEDDYVLLTNKLTNSTLRIKKNIAERVAGFKVTSDTKKKITEINDNNDSEYNKMSNFLKGAKRNFTKQELEDRKEELLIFLDELKKYRKNK